MEAVDTDDFANGKLYQHTAEKPRLPEPCGFSMKELHLDGGESSFTNLLYQLAQLHRGCLRELQSLRAEKPDQELSCQKQGSGTVDDTPHTDTVMPWIREMTPHGHDTTTLCLPTNSNGGEPIRGGHRETLQLPPGALPDNTSEHEEGHAPMLGTHGSMCSFLDEHTVFGEAETIQHMHSNAECFRLRGAWESLDIKLRKNMTFMHQASMALPNSRDTKDAGSSSFAEDTAKTYDGLLRHIIVYPASPKRIAWDVTGALFIFWDLIIMPLNLSALTPENSVFLDILDWLTLIFWTVNVFASLVVGYVDEGVTVMDPKKILLNYLKTWFVLDLVVVLPDWVFTFTKLSGGSSDGGGSVRILRIMRLARCMRLLRLAKLKAIFSVINDLINSEYTNIILNIVKMIVALVAINHWIGCFWFLTANSQTTNRTWITFHQFADDDLMYKYLTSFHWAITQFTPSSMHVQPQNTLERAYAITVIVLGLVGFSYLVGSITGSLAELRKMNADESKQHWNLRRYLKLKKVPTELSVRIQKYLEHKSQTRRATVPQESVILLNMISEQLHNELQRVISVPHMVVHPLFNHLNTESCVTMQRLARSAISRKELAGGDSLFFRDEEATDMSFVVEGRLQYIRIITADSDKEDDMLKEWVDKDEDWISEPILWTKEWHHLGELVAVVSTSLLLVNAEGFANIVKLNLEVHKFVNQYAAKYIKWINSLDNTVLSDITQGELVSEKIKGLMLHTVSRNVNSWRGSFASNASTVSTAKMQRPDFMQQLKNAPPFRMQSADFKSVVPED